jgi:hypothetical protein
VGVSIVRAAVAVIGGLMLLAGLAIVGIGGPGTLFAGLMIGGSGAAVLIGVALERSRYRSATAERRGDPPGPGGGEPADAPLDPRFRPTPEVFIDPTSGRRMRVLADPRTGERRYVAEA